MATGKNGLENLSDEKLHHLMKTFLKSLDPTLLKAARRGSTNLNYTDEQLFHALFSTIDDNAQNSELFARLHYIIDDQFSDMIDREIERSILSNTMSDRQRNQSNKSKLEQESASAITQTIAEGRDLINFRSEVLRRFQSVLTNLVDNFDQEFPLTLTSTSVSTLPGRTTDTLITDHSTIIGTSYELSDLVENRQANNTGGGSSVYNISYGSDSETSLTNGSGGRHRSFMFFDDNHLKSVADNLSPSKSDKIRLKALNDLLNYAPNEVISIGSWKILCPQLILALGDPNLEISTACLTLHSRLLAAANISVVCETLTNIVEHLLRWFSSPNVVELSASAISLDIQDPIIEMRFKQIRLILDFLQEATKYWIRYSENHVEHIINETIRLFSVGSIVSEPNGGRILPLHFVALLDPQSNWFRTWMHATHSRAYVLKSLGDSKALLVNAFQSLLNYAQTHSQQVQYGTDGNENGVYPSGVRKRQIGTASSDGSTRSNIPAGVGLPSSTSFLTSLGSGAPTSIPTPIPPPPAVPASSSHYTRVELSNAHFVHSIALIEHTICSKQARQLLFPITNQNDKPITLKDILRLLIQVMLTDQSGRAASGISCQLLKRVSSEPNTCGALMCNDELLEILIKPIKQSVGPKKNYHDYIRSNSNAVSERGLIRLADVFSALASNDIGYQYLIRLPPTQNPMTFAASIANFVKRVMTPYVNTRSSLIAPDLSATTSYTPIPINLLSQFLYVCRLIYSRASGLLAVKKIDLHYVLANALRIEIDRTHSPSNIRSFSAGSDEQIDRVTVSWKETLVDNLLLLGATPKGMFLLIQTGHLSECVLYICNRWRTNCQVGKLEQYGYGYLLAQMANTPAVISRLDQTGLIEHLIDQLWSELEYVPDDLTSVFPRRFPSEPISRYALKPLLSLLSVVSSFSAAYELLSNDHDLSSTPHNNDDHPKPLNLLTLLEWISFVSDDTGIRRLLCYEHTHTTGLRLLSVMQSDLDVQLMLESKYNYIAKLRQAQADMQSGGTIIIDQLSIARNHILVSGELYGGAREKYVPPWTLNENDPSLLMSIPLFSGSMPLPDIYTIKISHGSTIGTKTEETDLHRLLRSSRPDRLDEHWLNKCRHVFTSTLRNANEDSFPYSLMPDVLDAVVDINDKLHIDVVFNVSREPASSSSVTVQKADLMKFSSSSNLTPLQELGIQKAVKYGVRIGLCQDAAATQQNLTRLLKGIKTFLKQKSVTGTPSTAPGKITTNNSTTALNSSSLANLIASTGGDPNAGRINYSSLMDAYPGFDWFVTTVFFLMGCDNVRTWRWLRTFSMLLPSGFLWHARLFNTPFISHPMNTHGLHPVYAGTGHCVELIVEQELPAIFAAFRMSGFTISQIVVHWTKQCFWSILDWPDIVSYICICILYGIDHQIYFCVALLSHLQQDIIYQHSSRNLLPFLKSHQIRSFSMRQAFEYMLLLEKKYRSIVIPELKELLCSNTNASNTNSKQTIV